MFHPLWPLALAFLLLAPAPRVPSPTQVRARHKTSELVLLDRRGETIHELRWDDQARRLDWAPLGQVSPALIRAMVRAEDKRFYRHRGVDWLALGWAALETAARRPRGASTITMQLASRLETGLRPRNSRAASPARRRSLAQKWRQLRLALALEKSWSKAEILEAYLNLISFRGELQGVAAAAQGLFRREPHGLGNEESLLLAALPRWPAAEPERVAARAWVLARSAGIEASRARLEALAAASLRGPHLIRPTAESALHAALSLAGVSSQAPAEAPLSRGLPSLRSTLDAGLQRFASEALRSRLSSLSGQNAQDGAILVADNATGEVLAYVGNTGSLSQARHVDGARAPRQAGSTLKPFLYALALDQRLLSADSLLEDSPLDIPTGQGLFRPANYDHIFRGLVPAREALAASLNIPAVRLLQLAGHDAFHGKLQELGIARLFEADFYGPSLALGSAEVTLWELVNAYRTLANKGLWSGLRLAIDPKGVEAARRVYSPQAAFIISDILSDREARRATFGLESVLATRFWAAVKTGTSKDMRDNWCLGFSERYTVGVWVGNFSGRPMWNVSGMSGAAPAWLDVMNRLHEDSPSRAPAPPSGVIARELSRSGQRPARREYFLAGTEPGPEPRALDRAAAKVLYPPEGAVLALDPDMPPALERVLFEARPPDGSLGWRLNGEALGPADKPLEWAPRPGKFTLALISRGDKVLDSVRFEVRGEPDAEKPEPRAPFPEAR